MSSRVGAGSGFTGLFVIPVKAGIQSRGAPLNKATGQFMGISSQCPYILGKL
jgi:hypothetical protein